MTLEDEQLSQPADSSDSFRKSKIPSPDERFPRIGVIRLAQATQVRRLLSAVAFATTIIATIGAAFLYIQARQSKQDSLMDISRQFQADVDRLQTMNPRNSRQAIQDLNDRIAKVEAQLSSLSQIPENSKIAVELAGIKSSVEDSKKQLADLNVALLQTPAKALELPLLKRDIDNLKETTQGTFVALRTDIDRVYGLGEWFIGLMATMAVGLLSLAITNFLSRPKKAE